MTFFTQGALSRKSIMVQSGDSIQDKFKACESVVSINAPAEKVKSLKNKLESKYDSSLASKVYNSEEDAYFVKYEKQYSVFHNCNHELVEWLEYLGSDVSGLVFYKPEFIENMVPEQTPISFFP